MNMPVFEHIVRSLHALINDEKESLSRISGLIKYDPGLYFSLLQNICMLSKNSEVSTISKAVSLLGAQSLERHIMQQDLFMDEDYILLWCHSVLAGETAVLMNGRLELAEEEEIYFTAILPAIGMLFMFMERPNYGRICQLLLKLPPEDRVFIEDRLYKTSFLDQLDKRLLTPKIYRDIVILMRNLITGSGQRKEIFQPPAKFSSAHETFQLFSLMETAGAAARAVLFPSVVEAQEKFKELCKMYFKIPENEIEELLAEVIERFNDVCKIFMVEDLSDKVLSVAEGFHLLETGFVTKYDSIKNSLEIAYAAIRENKNIFICGEAGTGKRLLALTLHAYAENPRRTKPFIAFLCNTLDHEMLERDLFGSKGGFGGLQKRKGALEFANGGTIHLKDVDRIPIELQERLAEVFSKSEFYRIGEIHPISFDARLIITSKKDLLAEAREGRFSERLFEVISPEKVFIPPLRERREDIEYIADSIIKKYDLDLNDEALHLGLREYYETQPFPNNLKDLKRLLFYISAKHSLKA